MNALFLTQDSTLRLFYDLKTTLEEPLKLEKVGFYISGSAFFREFSKQVPDIESEKHTLVKEWETWEKAKAKNLTVLCLDNMKRNGEYLLYGML